MLPWGTVFYRKDEQKRLLAEGDKEGYKALKGSRYILTSNRDTLVRKDQEAAKLVEPKSTGTLFPIHSVAPRGGNQDRYEALLKSTVCFSPQTWSKKC